MKYCESIFHDLKELSLIKSKEEEQNQEEEDDDEDDEEGEEGIFTINNKTTRNIILIYQHNQYMRCR
jgi:hypothetical protein